MQVLVRIARVHLLTEAVDDPVRIEFEIFRIGANEAERVSLTGEFVETPFLNGLKMRPANAQRLRRFGQVPSGFDTGLAKAGADPDIVAGVSFRTLLRPDGVHAHRSPVPG